METKLDDIAQFANKEAYTLTELNQIKRLTDDVRNIFKKGAL